MQHIVHKHPPDSYVGPSQNLAHLNPVRATLVNEGECKADINVRVSFSCHVYSRTPEPGEIANLNDEIGRPRIFCPIRYACALDLSTHCVASIEKNYLTWESKDRNRVSSLMLVKSSNGDDYAVLYRLYPSPDNDTDVEFMVISAHLKDNIQSNPRKHNVRSLIKTCYYKKKNVP